MPGLVPGIGFFKAAISEDTTAEGGLIRKCAAIDATSAFHCAPFKLRYHGSALALVVLLMRSPWWLALQAGLPGTVAREEIRRQEDFLGYAMLRRAAVSHRKVSLRTSGS